MQTVYIDVLFFVNFILDLMIFFSASLILKRRERIWKFILVSLVGAAYSCAAFLVSLSPLLINIGAIILYAFCSIFVFGAKRFKTFIKCFTVVFVTAVCYGGILFLLYLFTGFGSISTFNNGALYIDLPVTAVLGFSFAAFSVLWLFSKINEYRHPENAKALISLDLFGKEVKLNAIIDSGNLLHENLSGLPVIVCDFGAVKKYLPLSVREFISSEKLIDVNHAVDVSIRLIPYTTVSGSSLLKAVKGDRLMLKMKKKSFVIPNFYIAFAPGANGLDDNIQALLPADILEMGKEINAVSDRENICKAERITER